MDNTTDRVTASVPQENAPSHVWIGDLAHDTSDYVRAWSMLLVSETRLARASVVRLTFAALIIPALMLGICITLDALVAAVLDRWLRDWSSCIAIVLLANLVGLYSLLLGMRRWWRNLSLPRSRDALAHLLQRMA